MRLNLYNGKKNRFRLYICHFEVKFIEKMCFDIEKLFIKIEKRSTLYCKNWPDYRNKNF